MNLRPLRPIQVSLNRPRQQPTPSSRCGQGGARERLKPRPSNLLRRWSRRSQRSTKTRRFRRIVKLTLLPARSTKASLQSASRVGIAIKRERSPADAHHLRFTQPRAMGRKVSDEFTVPLCRTHHRDVHRYGDEVAWWSKKAIDPVGISRKLWVST